MGHELAQDSKIEGPCPVCTGTAEFSLNKKGKPYFTCRSTCKSTFNMNGGDESHAIADAWLNDRAEVELAVETDGGTELRTLEPESVDLGEADAPDESEGDESDGQTSLSDLLNSED